MRWAVVAHWLPPGRFWRRRRSRWLPSLAFLISERVFPPAGGAVRRSHARRLGEHRPSVAAGAVSDAAGGNCRSAALIWRPHARSGGRAAGAAVCRRHHDARPGREREFSR